MILSHACLPIPTRPRAIDAFGRAKLYRKVCEFDGFMWHVFGVLFMLDHDEKTGGRRMTREKIDGLETWVTAFLRAFLPYCPLKIITQLIDQIFRFLEEIIPNSCTV